MKLFDNVLGGTKELTEMDMVMENIARTEEELRQKIFQLGQMFFDDHKNDDNPSDRYYDMIDQINKLDQNRMGFYKNKLRLEGKMICENCGAAIPYGSIFCSSCGKKADEKQAGGADVLKCSKCGAELEAGSQFCVSCGAKV